MGCKLTCRYLCFDIDYAPIQRMPGTPVSSGPDSLTRFTSWLDKHNGQVLHRITCTSSLPQSQFTI